MAIFFKKYFNFRGFYIIYIIIWRFLGWKNFTPSKLGETGLQKMQKKYFKEVTGKILEFLYYFNATIRKISCNEWIWIRLISSHNQKHFHKIITIDVMKFLWRVTFPYKGIDVTIIYRKKVKYIDFKRFHAQKCLELTPQPFPTQSYVGKGNAPFTRQT